jgi:NitT/TauT family transport system ATP-binding protein
MENKPKIEEAVGLADKVAVMSKSPGHVKAVVKVGLPRPRRIADVRNTPDFGLISHTIWEMLQDKPKTKPESHAAIQVSDAIFDGAVI